jgi:hypothetical protein
LGVARMMDHGAEIWRYLPQEGDVTMTAKTDHYDDIVKTVQLYIDGFNENDAGKFRQAFEKDAVTPKYPLSTVTPRASP